MNTIELFRVQADYNRWMNERLYAVCAGIGDAERRRDLGAFFRSIHGTLNHILLADYVWLGRLKQRPFPVISLGQELYADFAELRARRAETDGELADYVHGLAQDDLPGRVRYTSITSGKTSALPRGVVLTHVFNHQTHHRGQVTALISRLGYDFGVMDLIRLPGLEPACA
jgi:uncharacterized damage-inducible protein DinB